MDELGNYTNQEWFSSLNKFKLIRFVKELIDIWCYRAQLTFDTKKRIYPPTGAPFFGIKVGMLVNKNEEKIRNTERQITFFMEIVFIVSTNQCRKFEKVTEKT